MLFKCISYNEVFPHCGVVRLTSVKRVACFFHYRWHYSQANLAILTRSYVREIRPSRTLCVLYSVYLWLLCSSLTGGRMQNSSLSLQSQTVVHIFCFIGHREGFDFTPAVFLFVWDAQEIFLSFITHAVPAASLCFLVLEGVFHSKKFYVWTPYYDKRQQHGWFANWLLFVKLLTDKY